MGIIRKTASVATLGLIKFRSKGERLERVEHERDEAVAEAFEASEDRRRIFSRARRAEKRAYKAELDALAASKKAKREQDRAERLAGSKRKHPADQAVVASRRARRRVAKQLKKEPVASS